MNIKAVIALGGIILAIIGWGELRHYQGKSEQRMADLLSPADTVKRDLPAIRSYMPPETIYVKSGNTPQTPHKTAAPKVPARAPAVLPAMCDSLQGAIDSLLIPREATVVTSQGETIEVSYDPETENFTVIPHPLVIIQPTERMITRTLPELQSPSAHFWTGVDLLWSGTPGVIGHIGYDQVGLSLGNVAEKPCWGISLHLAL